MIAGRIFVFHLNQRVSWKVILVSSRYAKRRSLLKIRQQDRIQPLFIDGKTHVEWPALSDVLKRDVATLTWNGQKPRIEIHALLSGGVKIQTDADFQRMQYQ